MNKNFDLPSEELDKEDEDLPNDFDAKMYIALNPDIKDFIDPVLHFKKYGKYEKRQYKIADFDLPPDFDPNSYLVLNPDIRAAAADPKVHYHLYGKKEGRNYRLFDNEIPDDFDPKTYLLLNPDVESESDLRCHYINHGRREGRAYRVSDSDLPSDFHPHGYLELNPDVESAGIDPRVHYFLYGANEGRAYKNFSAEAAAIVDKSFDHTIRSHFSDLTYNKKLIDPKIIAFYLPQYHRIRENDEWWGEGFTEWVNVKKAKPNYDGHTQPNIPFDENYYDLTNPATQRWQADLAKEYGIHAFCYYMYWFSGRRLLEKPLDLMVGNKSIDMPFCVCWANENWTRTWDGRAQDILIAQNESPENDVRFIYDAAQYMRDDRYLRIDGKPMLLVYRADLINDSIAVTARWREELFKLGLGEVHLCAVQFYGITDPKPWGFDAAVEFPPHGWLVQENIPDVAPKILNKDFKGTLLDYTKSVDFAIRKPIPDYRWYRGCFPGWDNTARRQDTPHIFQKSNPFEFERWLTAILRQTILMNPVEHQFVFVNAWNEWGEGAFLEPDVSTKHLKLMAVNSALDRVKKETEPLSILSRLRTAGGYPGRETDEQSLLNLLRGHEQSIRALLAHMT